jgi:lactobin A/cerein 7B family class IIb bacteriocin
VSGLKRKWRMEMSKTITTTVDRGSEVRTLSDNEIENVNGGFIVLAYEAAVIGLALLFAGGEIAGGMIFDAYHGGDPNILPPEGVGLGA